MIAHTTLHVSDYENSKAFYIRTLALLGYTNNMEEGEAAGFNDGKNTDFCRTYALTAAENCGLRYSLPGRKALMKVATTSLNRSWRKR